MRLRLADGGGSEQRTITNRNTGETFSCPGEGLSGIFGNRTVRRERRAARTARRLYRIDAREGRHDARVDARGERNDARIDKHRPDEEPDTRGGVPYEGDDEGDDDQDNTDPYDQGEEMNDGDYTLSGVGKLLVKGVKGVTKKPEAKKVIDNKPFVPEKSWFKRKTNIAGMEVDNTALAVVGGGGLLYLLAKHK